MFVYAPRGGALERDELSPDLDRDPAPFQYLKAALLAVLLVVAAGQIAWLVANGGPKPAAQLGFGELDFIAFWAGVQTWISGGNPYDYAQVRAIQEAAGYTEADALPFLNPPWTLPLLAPFCVWSFSTSGWVWIACNLGFLAASALALRQALGEQRTPAPVFVFGAFAFLPCLFVLLYGQLPLMILCALSGALWALRTERDWLAGLLLVPLSAKPHLLLPFLLAGGIWVLRERRWKVAGGLAGGFAILVLVTAPHYAAFFSQPETALLLKTSSSATQLRRLILASTGTLPTWPLLAFPVVGLVSVGIWALRSRFEPKDGTILGLLAVSIVFAPYTWFWDFTLLLPLHLFVFSRLASSTVPTRTRAAVAVALFAVPAATIPVSATGDLTNTFWFPYALIAVWIWATRVLPAEHS